MAKRHKRKVEEEAEHNERWMVSYADFITLLFAFFVVMYSISSVNEGKYKVLTNSLGDAFSSSSEHHPAVDQNAIITLDNAPGSIEIQPIKLDKPPLPMDNQTNALSEEITKERESLNNVSNQFQEVLSSFVDQQLVNVNKHDFWIELEMNSEMLFNSGEAELSEKAIPVIKKIAEVVKKIPNMVAVEGYTDNIPIKTVKFPSNWDLASARATSVVKAFATENVDPVRLSAVGYGEFHPVADNSTEEGRFKNRRVVLLILSRVFSRYGSDDKERARLLNLGTGSDSGLPVATTLPTDGAEHKITVNQQNNQELPVAVPNSKQ